VGRLPGAIFPLVPATVDPHSVQRQLSDAAASPNARVLCLLLGAALCATARLSQKCLTGTSALATSLLAARCVLFMLCLTVHVE
jgi:hypothetical protein